MTLGIVRLGEPLAFPREKNNQRRPGGEDALKEVREEFHASLGRKLYLSNGESLSMSADKKLNVVTVLIGLLTMFFTFSIYLLREMKDEMREDIKVNASAIAEVRPRVMLLESLSQQLLSHNEKIEKKIDTLIERAGRAK